MLKISPSFLRQYSCYDITNGCAEHVEDKILNIANTDLENKLQQLDCDYHTCRQQKEALCVFKRLSSIGRSTPHGKNRARLPMRFLKNGTSTNEDI